MRYFLLAWSQIGWFGCVYAAKNDIHFLAIFFPSIAWILLLGSKVLSKRSILVLFSLAMLGSTFDSVMASLELISLKVDPGLSSFFNLPIWLISVWFLFVSILPFLADLFKARYFFTFLAGMVGGPLTYRSGEAFEVLYLSSTISFVIYAIFWGLYLVFSLYLLRKSYAN